MGSLYFWPSKIYISLYNTQYYTYNICRWCHIQSKLKKIDSNLLLFLDRNSTRSTPQKKNDFISFAGVPTHDLPHPWSKIDALDRSATVGGLYHVFYKLIDIINSTWGIYKWFCVQIGLRLGSPKQHQSSSFPNLRSCLYNYKCHSFPNLKLFYCNYATLQSS